MQLVKDIREQQRNVEEASSIFDYFNKISTLSQSLVGAAEHHELAESIDTSAPYVSFGCIN